MDDDNQPGYIVEVDESDDTCLVKWAWETTRWEKVEDLIITDVPDHSSLNDAIDPLVTWFMN